MVEYPLESGVKEESLVHERCRNRLTPSGSTILITGGAGFIGSNVAAHLANADNKVIVFDNLENGLEQNVSNIAGVELRLGDVRDMRSLRLSMSGVDLVVHLAALGSVPRSISSPCDVYDVNVNGICNTLEAARLEGVGRVIYASSSSVYGDSPEPLKVEGFEGSPISPYACSKLAGELIARTHCRTYGMSVLGLRFFNVYGPKQRPDCQYAAAIPLFTKAILERVPPTIFGDGEQVRDFTYVGDVVQAVELALTASGEFDGRAINVARGEGYTVSDLVRRIADLVGVKVAPSYLPSRPGDVHTSRADITRAQLEIGYQPSCSLGDGLKNYVDWYSSEPHARVAAS